jgi:hypothetical protein
VVQKVGGTITARRDREHFELAVAVEVDLRCRTQDVATDLSQALAVGGFRPTVVPQRMTHDEARMWARTWRALRASETPMCRADIEHHRQPRARGTVASGR